MLVPQVTLASRDMDILVSTISSSSSPSRFSINTRASSNNTLQPLTQGPFRFPNHRPTPLLPSSSP
jgi:hypothetical protein